MLSRRRRFASTSFKCNGKRLNLANDDDDDENVAEGETNERCNDEIFIRADSSTSTRETPTVRFDDRWFALSDGHVGDDGESENVEKSEKWTDRSTRDDKTEKWTDRSMRDGKTEKWTDRSTRDEREAEKLTDRSTRDGKTEKWTDRSTHQADKTEKPTDRLVRDERGTENWMDRCTGDESIARRACHVDDSRKNSDAPSSMSFPIQFGHRATQRNAVNTMKRRRRKSPLSSLDSNEDDVFHTSSSLINNRTIDDSCRSKVTESFDKATTTNHSPIDDPVASSRINDHQSPRDDSDTLICAIIPDNDQAISRTRRELYESRARLNRHRYADEEFLSEHKSSRRRRFEEIPSCAARMRKNHALLSQWTLPKFRLIVIIGLLTWTTLMINGVAGRQNHHRTCPGCPHQHVHTINRKSGGNYEEERSVTSGDSETSPSPDDLRLEAIKHQILTKLGLRSRPDVNRTLASVPRHLALETLYRAEAQPSGYGTENDDYHEGGRGEDHHRNLGNEDEDSLSLSASSSSSSSSSKKSSSSSSQSSSSSSLSSSSSSSSASSATSSSSSSSYGRFYYDGEEYSYRNVDEGDLDGNEKTKMNDNDDDSTIDGSYADDDRHRGHGGHFDDDDKRHDYHRRNENKNDDETQIEMDDFYARTSEIISFAEPGRTLNGQPLLEFPRSSGDPALEPLRIKRATLWARVELRHAHHYQHHRRAQSNQRNITLWVFRVRCGNVTHLRGKELGEHLEMVTSLGVKVNQLGWQKFDVTRVVSNWYSGHEAASTRNEKLTLLVDCTGCGSHVHVSTFGVQSPHIVEPSLNANGGQDPDRPFLVVRTDPAAVKRVRRRAIECSGAIKGQCCKQRFYVSFSQLGWDDWIIAPQGYYANYCRGDCAAGHRTPDTFLNYYTHVIEEYRKMDRLAGMQPCCAPLKFSPMSLIYYGPDSNIIKRDLPKMVVDECGCP